MHLTAPVHSPYTGRDRLDQVVAIRRNDWTRSSECATGRRRRHATVIHPPTMAGARVVLGNPRFCDVHQLFREEAILP